MRRALVAVPAVLALGREVTPWVGQTNPDGFKVPGGTLGYDADAQARAEAVIHRFLVEHLGS